MTNISAKIVYNEDVLLDIRSNMKSANISCLDRGSLSSIVEYGCYANTGEFTFVDYTKTFQEIYESGILYDCSIKIFISANYGENRKLIATFLIEDFEYEDTYVVHVTLKDPILKLQNHPFPKIREFDKISLYDIFNKYCYGVKLSNVSESIFREINIRAAYAESSSLWDFVNKLCQATLCQCCSDTDGIPIIVSPLPSKYGICSIRPKHIKTIAEKVSKDKTKIAGASISFLKRIISENLPVGDEKHKTIYNTYLVNNDLILEGVSLVADENNSEVKAVRDGQYISVSYTINSNGTIHRLTSDGRSRIIAKEIFGPSVNNDGNFPYNVQTITKRKYIETTEKKFSISSDGKSASVTTNFFSINNAVGTNYIDIYTDIYCTIYGDFFVDEGEGTRSFGSETNATQLSTNELIQFNSKWGTTFLPEKILSIIEEKYSNGIDCVELECIIGDYTYANSTTIRYSPSNPDLKNHFSFNRYDIVRPYVIKNGVEVPYSTDAGGNPKDFVIIGIRYNYDGILRQSLMLQEFTPYTI